MIVHLQRNQEAKTSITVICQYFDEFSNFNKSRISCYRYSCRPIRSFSQQLKMEPKKYLDYTSFSIRAFPFRISGYLKEFILGYLKEFRRYLFEIKDLKKKHDDYLITLIMCVLFAPRRI